MALTASQLAAQGIKRKAGVNAMAIDPRTSRYFGGGVDERGVDLNGIGNAGGQGYFDFSKIPGMEGFTGVTGTGQDQTQGFDREALASALSDRGYTLMEEGENAADGTNKSYSGSYRWLQDANGGVVGEKQFYKNTSVSDQQDMLKVLAAAAGGQAAFGGEAAVGAEAVSGMDLAADAAAGSGNYVGAAGGATGTAAAPAAAGTTGTTGTSASTVTGKAGATGMGANDWIQLGNLAAGLYASGRAQDSADQYAGMSAEMAREMLDFSKQQYADSLPYIKAAQDKSLQVADAQLASQKQSDALAADYATYNKETFRPLEQKMVADAAGYDTPERRQAAADTAMAGVNTSMAGVREAAARRMAASGINPGSTRALAAQDGNDVAQASALSSAAFNARKGVEDTAVARQTNAVSLGRNLPANQVASSQAAVQAGNSAVNTSVAGANAGVSNAGLVQSGFLGAAGATTAAGNLQARANDAATQLWGNLGTTAGRFITSDENMKTDIAGADPEEALEEVTATPVSKFKYDPSKMAAAGIPMERPAGEEQTGAMAQDVNAVMGEEAAPGGKKLNVGTMIGKTMLAVQALNKKVTSLAAMIDAGQLEVEPA